MKVVVQRCSSSKVTVDGKTAGEIGSGLLLLVCFEKEDTEADLVKAAEKISKLRIFEDENERMNLDVRQTKGKILSVSQFTLSWDGNKGHRPSFDRSMPPAQAESFYRKFNKSLEDLGLEVQTGVFGADMKVECVNDGPVTFHLSF